MQMIVKSAPRMQVTVRCTGCDQGHQCASSYALISESDPALLRQTRNRSASFVDPQIRARTIINAYTRENAISVRPYTIPKMQWLAESLSVIPRNLRNLTV